MNNIHQTAIIEDGAKIGNNVTIGPFSIISKNVVIGDNTIIDSHVCIYGNTTIGKDNKIFSHAVLGSIPQDLKFEGEDVELIIGNRNQIREFTFFNPGTKGGGSKTIIGDDSLFMGYVHIGHDCIIGNKVIIANSCQLAGHVIIENEVVIGGLTGIIQFVKIGQNVMIGASSLIDQDIPPYTLAQGNRAVLRGLNINGLRRKYSNREIINSLKTAYQQCFNSEQPLQDVVAELLEHNIEEIRIFANFIKNTKKGIPYNKK